MKNILVARIDDRLIHGQVVTSWIRSYPITNILIVAEDLANNQLMQRIYKSVAPEGIEVTVLNNQDAIQLLAEKEGKSENLMLLAKTPEVFEFLVDHDVPLSKIVLGGMGSKPGRETLIRNISANVAERESFRRLIQRGIKIVYQMVPVDKEIEIEKLL
ncbi:MAG: PTS sugar transporter subunit IIB [Chloroflexi bacterium]|jgi:PTS system mannose-specific IIB component|nr:PTS sugar transporter subunit IIB [Chloroflexota bacterium]